MSNINILNQIIDDEEGTYRIRFGARVGYLQFLRTRSMRTPCVDRIC
jgi:hypothetical protein